jgi:hypothetical protein
MARSLVKATAGRYIVRDRNLEVRRCSSDYVARESTRQRFLVESIVHRTRTVRMVRIRFSIPASSGTLCRRAVCFRPSHVDRVAIEIHR